MSHSTTTDQAFNLGYHRSSQVHGLPDCGYSTGLHHGYYPDHALVYPPEFKSGAIIYPTNSERLM